MRCLTLADALRKQGAECVFVCRLHVGTLMSQITQRGHRGLSLPALTTDVYIGNGLPSHTYWLGTDWQADARDTQATIEAEQLDWLVIDHYALDYRWEQSLRPYCKRMMVIDDLADRSQVCDVLLDQNLGRVEDDYLGLIPQDCKCLIGPKYALLRPEFAEQRSESLKRRKPAQLKHILISMGGIDKDNITCHVLNSLSSFKLTQDMRITVVMGLQAPWLLSVQQKAASMAIRTQVLAGVNDMAKLMKESDLMICAAGGTSWERCCLGVPGIQLVLAENQVGIATALARAGAAITANRDTLSAVLSHLSTSEDAKRDLLAMTHAARSIVDGFGARYVVNVLVEGK